MIDPISITAFELAQRWIRMKEIPGKDNNPQIVAMLSLDNSWAVEDEIPWCSAFANYVCWLLRLPRSKSLAARSWLDVGHSVNFVDAEVGFDIVILKRGGGNQPGPEVRKAQGHVGFFGGWSDEVLIDYATLDTTPKYVKVLGGNQNNEVNVSTYGSERILGIHRLRS